MDLPTDHHNQGMEQKLVFRMDNYHVALQKSLHKQWIDGQNCDLIICTHSCDFAVHSCVVACHSAKISDHLLQASVARALASITGINTYDSDDGIVRVSVLKSGEKRVQMEADSEILELLIKFMYTGTLHVPPRQTVALLHLAQLLGMTVVVNVVQVYIERNHDVASSQSRLQSETSFSLFSDLPSCVFPDSTANACSETSAPLQLDSVELNVSSVTVDADLAAYISSPDCTLGKSAEKESSMVSTRTRKQRNLRKKEVEVKLQNDEYLHVPVHFDKTSKEKSRVSAKSKVSDVDELNHVTSANSDINAEAEGCEYDSCQNNDDDDTALENVQKDDEGDSADQESAGASESLPFSCEYCHKGYRQLTDVRHHMEWKHRSKVFTTTTCPHTQCDKQFDNLVQYRGHCKDIHGDYVCEIDSCTYTANTQRKIEVHDSCAHKGKFKCTICKLYAPTKRGLTKHYNNVHACVTSAISKKKFVGKIEPTHHKNLVHNHKGARQSELDTHMATKKGFKKTKTRTKRRSKKMYLATTRQTDIREKNGQNSQTETNKIKNEFLDEESVNQQSSDNDTFEQLKNPILEADAQAVKVRNKIVTTGRLIKAWCRLCNKQMDCEDAYYEHLNQKHHCETFPCKLCNKVFLRKESMTSHIHTYHDQRKLICPYCAKVFTVTTQFSSHCKSDHGDTKPFHCQVCKYRCNRAKSLLEHEERIHTAERKLEVCDKCGGSFLYLKKHQRNCLQLEQHLCQTCGEVFPLRSSLKSHISVVHGGEKAYACHVCHRRFSCHGNRNRHMRIHNNSFPYTCEFCGQKFRHSNTLKEHIKHIHENRPQMY